MPTCDKCPELHLLSNQCPHNMAVWSEDLENGSCALFSNRLRQGLQMAIDKMTGVSKNSNVANIAIAEELQTLLNAIKAKNQMAIQCEDCNAKDIRIASLKGQLERALVKNKIKETPNAND